MFFSRSANGSVVCIFYCKVVMPSWETIACKHSRFCNLLPKSTSIYDTISFLICIIKKLKYLRAEVAYYFKIIKTILS